jgi:nitrite reductase (NO-forming)
MYVNAPRQDLWLNIATLGRKESDMRSVDELVVSRRGLFRDLGAGGAALALGALVIPTASAATTSAVPAGPVASPKSSTGKFLIADPTRIPPPIARNYAVHETITLTAEEHEAELSPGAKFRFMTFNGQIPGPMIRIREGDTVTFTLKSAEGNFFLHNIDMHAIYGSGGGAGAMTVRPGESKTETFKAMFPGAFIYHCAVAPDMDMHISCGMYGMILVEPKDGLPKVDREFYLGQNEVYTDKAFGTAGTHTFDYDRILAENPTYVVLNGAADALTAKRGGAMKAKVGETVRVFLVNGGPNLASSFHPIGNIWSEAWPQGALANPPLRYVQTQTVPPGSTFIGHMNLPVPETLKLVDHALTRVAHKGLMAEMVVEGAPDPNIYRS